VSTLTGRPAHDGGCYHCNRGAEPCICPGKPVEPPQDWGHTIPITSPLSPEDARALEAWRTWVEVENNRMALEALQGVDKMAKGGLFPRRRDVRDMAEELLHAHSQRASPR
jgi:hypothetical protein